MIGTKFRQKKSQMYVFLTLYGLLGLVGCAMAALSIRSKQNVSGAVGFMIVFGLGMAVNTLIKSRKVQVSVSEDFIEVDQSRTPRTLRYRAMTGVSRPNKDRLVITFREDGVTKNEVIWTKELEPAEVQNLYDFLKDRKGQGK